MDKKIKVAIIGAGNIGMDLMYKVMKSDHLEMGLLTNRRYSDNTKLAESIGVKVSDKGIQAIVDEPDCAKIVFDSTTAKAHIEHAPIFEKLNKIAIDMTPASVGVQVAPAFNLEENLDAKNINLISCGGQAVIPIIRSIVDVVEVEYAEAVNASASKGVGMGTRENIDEYTDHTGRAMVEVGGAKTAKALIVINPAEPPIPMHNTIFAICKELTPELSEKIDASIRQVVKDIQSYVPGYVMSTEPQYDFNRKLVTVMVEIVGAGDFLPTYAGNLDIITQAAVKTANRIAENIIKKGD